MADKIYSLNVPHGIKRDGTNFETGEFTEGQWTRFQRGRPRKVGGYRLMSANPNPKQIPRGMVSQSRNGNTYTFTGSQAGVNVYINANDNGIAQGPFYCTLGNELYLLLVNSAPSANSLTFVGDQTPSGSNLLIPGGQLQIFNSVTKAYSSYTIGSSYGASSGVIYSPTTNLTTVTVTTTPNPSWLTSTPASVVVSKSPRFNSSTPDQYTWNFGINYSPSGGAYNVIAHAPKNLENVDSTDQAQVYVGNIEPKRAGAWVVTPPLRLDVLANSNRFTFYGDLTSLLPPGTVLSTTSTGTLSTTVSSSQALMVSIGASTSVTFSADNTTISVNGNVTAYIVQGAQVNFNGVLPSAGGTLYTIASVPVYANNLTTFILDRGLEASVAAGTIPYVLTTALVTTSSFTTSLFAGNNLFSFDTTGGTPTWSFTALADTTGANPTGAPIKADGGICVLYPFLFAYGSNGFIANNHVASYAPSTSTTTSYVSAGTAAAAIAVGATTMSVTGSLINTFPAGTIISFTNTGTTTYSTVGTPTYDGTKTTFSVTPAIVTAVTSGATVFKQTITTVSSGTYLQNSFTDWNGPTANQINLAAGKILKGLPVRGGTNSPSGLFWATNALIRVSFTGQAPLYWSNDIISTDCTCLSGAAVVQQDAVYYWMGTDRFYLYNGTVQVLPNDKNLNWVYDNLNYTYRSKVWGVSVPKFNEVWWFYPRGTSTECNAVVIYNTKDQIWYDLGDAPGCRRSCGVAPGLFPYPIFAGNTYEPFYGLAYTNIVSAGGASLTITGDVTQNVPGTYLTLVNPNLTDAQKAIAISVYLITAASYSTASGTSFLSLTPNLTPYPSSSVSALIAYQTVGGYPLWQHDYGVDRVFYTDITAIESAIETSDIGFLNGDPSTDTNAVGLNRRMKIFRIEPDFIQEGPMTLQIRGRAYASDKDYIDGNYSFDPDTQKIDIHQEFRILRLRFTSNIEGGDFQMGRLLVIAEPGDERA